VDFNCYIKTRSPTTQLPLLSDYSTEQISSDQYRTKESPNDTPRETFSESLQFALSVLCLENVRKRIVLASTVLVRSG